MANYLDNNVGTRFNFLHIDIPQMISRKVNYSSRTGVDGYAVWEAGQRGEPFVANSWADFPTKQAASDEWMLGYCKARGTGIWTLVWEDGFATQKQNVVIVNVERAGKAFNPIAVGVGGVTGQLIVDGASLAARWTLLTTSEASI